MAGESEFHTFQFTWKIEEFSLSRKRFEECHKSPAFYVGPIKFDISLYPRGKNNGEYISLFINRIQQQEVDDPGEILLDICFSLKNFEDDAVLLRKESTGIKLNRNQCIGYENFVERELVVNSGRRRYLPKDSLAIHLAISVSYTIDSDQENLKEGLENLSNDLKFAFERKIMTDFTLNTGNESFKVHKALVLARVPQLADLAQDSNHINIEASVLKSLLTYIYSGKLDVSAIDLPHKLYQTAKELKMKSLEQKLLPVAIESSARTILKGERITLTWTITNFLSRNRYERVFSPLLQNGSSATTMLKLIFCIERDNEGKDILVFYIRRLRNSHESEDCLFLACSICVLDNDGDRNCSSFFEHLYTSEDEWKVQYLHKTTLLKTPAILRNNDSMTFIFDIIINDKDDWSEINGISFLSETANVNEVGRLAFDLEEKLYRNSINYDVIFKSQGVEFPVHKFILASRSSKFLDMFIGGNIDHDITDISADTVDRMFLYMYTGKTDMYSYEITEGLYKAAAKYKIRDLQVKCASKLKDYIAKEKAYPLRILEVAGLNEDEDLKVYTLNFLASNCPEILGTQEWIQFLRKNPELGGSALQYISKKLIRK